MVATSSAAATPVHRWQAEGNANDSVGTNHGTLVGNATASGTPAAEGTNAFSFDGNGDWVEMPSVASHYFAGSFTVEAWARTLDATGRQRVVTKYECGEPGCPTPQGTTYTIIINDGVLQGWVRDSDGGGPDFNGAQIVESSELVADGNFHHLKLVRDVPSDLVALYADGDVVGLEQLAGPEGPMADDDGQADPLFIGATSESGPSAKTEFFTGLIDDVRLFNEGAVLASDFDPTLTDTDPDSPANENSPEIKGSAVPGSTVNLYTDAACTGSPVATGTAAEFASPGLTPTVPLPDDSTTTFYATAMVGTATSACSSDSINYAEQTSPQFLVDGLIKRSKDASFLGDGTYNQTGQNQTVQSKARRATKKTFNLLVENDGTDPDTVAVTGCAKSRGFKVSYLDGTTNVTSIVTTSSGYSFGLASGARKALTLVVKVKTAGPRKKTCPITVKSQGALSSQDAVTAKVRVKG